MSQQIISRALEYPLDEVVARYSREQKLSREIAERHFLELKRYLCLCALTEKRYPMTMPIDEAWHTFLLYTIEYMSFCEAVAGRFIHHHPKKPLKSTEKEDKKAYAEFLHDYEHTFGEPPAPEFWPRLHVLECTPCNHCHAGDCSTCSTCD